MIIKTQKYQQAVRRAAFTLMEMLVVVAIIVALAGISIPMYFGYLDNSKMNAAKLGCKNLEMAVMGYYTDNGVLPQNLQVLLQPNPNTGKAYIDQRQLVDPWNNPYQYNPGQLNTMGIPLIMSQGNPSNGKQISNFDK